MDSNLEQAALQRNVEFLRKAFASKTRDYFLSLNKDGINIFHIMVRVHAGKTFINEALHRLPKEDVQNLLSQQATLRKWNPLHFAALYGTLETVNLILGAYISTTSSSYVVESNPSGGGKPWLAHANDGRTPLHLFLEYNNDEECGLKILSMDMELLCGMVDNNGNSPLYLAVNRGFSKLAHKILDSEYCYSVSGQQHGFDPIEVMSRCSEEVWKLLYKKNPEFLYITNSEDETSVLHEWAKDGVLRPLTLLEETIGVNALDKFSRLQNKWGDSPLHTAINHGNQAFAICLAQKCGIIQSNPQLWQCENYCGITPLDLALDKCFETLAFQFVSNYAWSYKEPNCPWKSRLVVAAKRRMCGVVERICNNIDLEMIADDLLSNTCNQRYHKNGQVVLFIMSHCTEEVWRSLYNKYPEVLHVIGKNRTSLFHEWAKKGKLWPLLLLEEVDLTSFEQLSSLTNDNGDTPLHVAIDYDNEAFALCLVAKCRKQDPPLWQCENKNGVKPIDLALHQRLENLVLHCISRDCTTYKEYSSTGESRLFIAVENGMDQVVQKICECVAMDTTHSIIIPTENQNHQSIFYVLSNCTESIAELLLKTFPHLVYKLDKDGKRPIDIAAGIGAPWLTKLLIAIDPSSIAFSPSLLINLCKRGHLEAVEAFIKRCGNFRQMCIELEDSPLHHIELTTYSDYEKFLAIPMILKMKNNRDFDGKTPLHRALERQDIVFAEVLLMKGVNRSVRDRRRKTATNLLVELCDQYNQWEEMCQRVGINPRSRYLKSSVTEMPTTLSAFLTILLFTSAFIVLCIFLIKFV